MRLRRRIANFFLKSCGLHQLHGTGLQKFTRAVFDEIDLQHLRETQACRSFAQRMDLYQFVHDSCVQGGAIDYLEFGVFKGESIRFWAGMNQHPESRFFGFDSFEGLPEDWRKGQDKGHFSVAGNLPDIRDPRVQFLKGWFDATVPPFARDFKAQRQLVLHLDADLYSSTMLPLMHFSPFMAKGTLLLFDEFYDRDHEFKALMDWQRIHRRKFSVVGEVGDFSKICVQVE